MDLDLIRPLLQLSDRHPVGCHSRAELGIGSDTDFETLLTAGVLIQRPIPKFVDDALVIERDERAYLVPASPEDQVEEISLDELQLYDLDLKALATQLRRTLGLKGTPVAPRTPHLLELGSRLTGQEHEAIFLARGAAGENLLDLLGIARIHDPGPRWTILTALDWEPSAKLSRDFEHYNARILSLEDIPSGNTLPPFGRSQSARLVINTGGRTVMVDADDLRLPPREFSALTVLAAEAGSEGGFVCSEALANALAEATGSDDRYPDEQVNKVISLLRKAIGGRLKIETRRKSGYRLCLDPAEIDIF